jgi:hypothetical protein
MDHRLEDHKNSHRPLSPASPQETLFLAGLTTANISADALASQLRGNGFSFGSSVSVNTVATDDFFSAVGNIDDLADFSDADQFSKTQASIPELDSDTSSDEEEQQETMAATKVSSTAPMPAKKTAPGASGDHPDAAAYAYEGAKGAWAWGKGISVFSPFLGLAESVAGKALEVAGTNLEEVDGTIKPQLKSLDNGVLNPAIEKVVGIVLGAVGKTEGIIKPIIITLLSPFGMIEKEKSNETPEVTK